MELVAEWQLALVLPLESVVELVVVVLALVVVVVAVAFVVVVLTEVKDASCKDN